MLNLPAKVLKIPIPSRPESAVTKGFDNIEKGFYDFENRPPFFTILKIQIVNFESPFVSTNDH